MTKLDVISIVVPVYNVEEYLSRCVNSIINQTYENLEIILVNDGSTDNSGYICNALKTKDNRIKVIHKRNGGLSSARNAGISVATGKYLTFVDSDDWISLDIYEHCIELFISEEYDVVDFNCVTVKENKPNKLSNEAYALEKVNGKENILYSYLLRGQTKKVPFSVCRKVYKRDLFNKITFPEGKINEDIVTNYKILAKCKKIVYTSKIGYFYYQESESLTRGGLKRRDFDLLHASKELVLLAKNENYKDIKYLASIKLARSYFSLLSKIAYFGVDDEAIDKKKLIKDLTKKLRESLLLLIKSPMPLNRKIIATILSVNINLMSIPLKLYKKIKSI